MNILDALSMKGVDVRHSPSDENEYTICCLFCHERGVSEDTEYKLGFNTQSGDAHCFRCDWGLRRDGVKALAEKIEMLEYVDEGLDLKKEKEVKPPKSVDLPEDFCYLDHKLDTRDREGHKALKYLVDRGMKKWQLSKHGIGYCLSGFYAWRIVVPVYWGKTLKGLVGRSFAGQEPRYLNTPGMKCIHGLPRKKKVKTAVLCEGVFDEFSIERALVWGCLRMDVGAILGHSLTDFQIKQLEGYDKLILFPDGDKAGITHGMLKVAAQLKKEFKVYVADPVMGQDPGELTYKALVKRIEASVQYSETISHKLRAKVAFEE